MAHHCILLLGIEKGEKATRRHCRFSKEKI
jgi:hypothetical protein